MTYPEGLRGYNHQPHLEAALKFCEELQTAIRKTSTGDNDAQTAEVSVIHQSAFGVLPYKLKVTVADGIYSHTSENYNVIEENPGPFIASEVREIDTEKVVFYDFPKGPWFVVFGHDMNIEPVFSEEE